MAARQTGFYWDERCFWHGGGNYAFTVPVGGHVQPPTGSGLPEHPETKRRMKNLMDVSGLMAELSVSSAPEASHTDLLRVHPESYLSKFKEVSDAGGGELGQRTPFGPGGYEIAALSTGLVIAAVREVLTGQHQNAYALSRPPGHHCLPDYPMGFCLFANIAVAIEAAFAEGHAKRIAVLDWDVHHGNGTEAIFYDRDDVLTVSIHQERNYPMDKGVFEDRGSGKGAGFNLNIPLPPGSGHVAYLRAMERLALPAIKAYKPDLIIIACGFDASLIDPLSRMMATADTFRQMTKQVMALADEVCGGRLVMAHEGGYSETYVPFCGHAVIEEMSGAAAHVEDPFAETFALRQPSEAMDEFIDGVIEGFETRLRVTG